MISNLPVAGVRIADVYNLSFQHAEAFGWEIDSSNLKINWSKLVQAVQDHIKSVNWTTKVSLKEKYAVLYHNWLQLRHYFQPPIIRIVRNFICCVNYEL